MKQGPILLLALLLLGAGVIVWRLDSGRSTNGPTPQPGPAGTQSAPHESVPLSREEPSASKPAEPLRQPLAPVADTSALMAKSNPPPPAGHYPLQVPDVAQGVTAGDASGAVSTKEFESKYAGATEAELRASYQNLSKYFQDNREGRIENKEEMLDPEAMRALEQELGWLKEKAYGGG